MIRIEVGGGALIVPIAAAAIGIGSMTLAALSWRRRTPTSVTP